MSDPFVAALDALFSAPGSAAAVYQPDFGEPVAIRVIISSRDDDRSFGSVRMADRGLSVQIKRADAPMLKRGEIVAVGATIGDSQFVGGDPVLALDEDPRSDVEALTWLADVSAVE